MGTLAFGGGALRETGTAFGGGALRGGTGFGSFRGSTDTGFVLLFGSWFCFCSGRSDSDGSYLCSRRIFSQSGVGSRASWFYGIPFDSEKHTIKSQRLSPPRIENTRSSFSWRDFSPIPFKHSGWFQQNISSIFNHPFSADLDTNISRVYRSYRRHNNIWTTFLMFPIHWLVLRFLPCEILFE